MERCRVTRYIRIAVTALCLAACVLQEFKSLVANGRTDAAASLVTFAPDYRMTPNGVAHQLSGQPHTILVRRNWLDLLLARQRYNVSGTPLMCWVQDGSSFHHRLCAGLKVERGKIKYEWGPKMAEFHSQERRDRGLPPLPYNHYRL
jgi:hypothetical protein